MTQLLNENSLTILSIILGSIIGIAAIIVSLKQNKKKKISYEINALTPLFEVKNNSVQDFEIRYKNEIVKQVYFSEITIENYGTLPIKRDDFEKPIEFTFKNCKHIFSVEILDVSPKNLIVNVDANSNENNFRINPLLLNPTDFIKLKIIMEGENISIDINSRIVDIKSIENKKQIKYRANENISWIALIIGTIFIISGALIDSLIWLIGVGCGLFGYGSGFLIPAKIRFFKK